MTSRADKRWNAALLWGWAAVLAWACFTHLAPTSLWFDVEAVAVHDTVAGQAPEMDIVRTIERPFRADWTVTVLRAGPRGFYNFCTAHGANAYRPENELPQPVDLDWWTWPTQCALPPGEYYLVTVWTIQPNWFPEKDVWITSNVFTVHPAAD